MTTPIKMSGYRPSSAKLNAVINSHAHILNGAANDYDPLLDLVGDARVVLLGEATHGTREFYRERARITQRLITEKDFTAVAVEADWPDAYRVNRYVRNFNISGTPNDENAKQALDGFKRFPSWMWRNADVAEFVEWLREYNDRAKGSTPKAGFYGLDLYSLFSSIEEVLRCLSKIDPAAAQRARERYACFDHFNKDGLLYGHMTSVGTSKSCEQYVISQLSDLYTQAANKQKIVGQKAGEALFYTQQNARLIVHAEEYYRTMFKGQISSWNLRDQHMAETLDNLMAHLTQANNMPAKIVVWAHNSHIGDARASEFGLQGKWNLGQLARTMYGAEALLIGLTTGHGTVTAASNWDAFPEVKSVGLALQDSYEAVLHDSGIPSFMLSFREKNSLRQVLSSHRLTRVIGVIYRPETERQSHYMYSLLPQQFDAILHFDETRAVEPLDPANHLVGEEVPNTFPGGF